jgi:hypothetical protein
MFSYNHRTICSQLGFLVLALALLTLPLAGITIERAPILTPLATDLVPLGTSLQSSPDGQFSPYLILGLPPGLSWDLCLRQFLNRTPTAKAGLAITPALPPPIPWL